jgi:hypothetical protein
MVAIRTPVTLSSMRDVIPTQWSLLNNAFQHMDPLITQDLLHVENAFCSRCGERLRYNSNCSNSFNELQCVGCRFKTSLFAFRFGRRDDYQFCARVAWLFAHDIPLSAAYRWIGFERRAAAARLYQQLRHQVSVALHRDWKPITGVAEVDETMLGYCHGGVGFQPLRVWIIGLCERVRGGRMICRCLYDQRRNSQTCVTFITDYCKLGTTI